MIKPRKEQKLDNSDWELPNISRKIRVSHLYSDMIAFEESWFQEGDTIEGFHPHEELLLTKKIEDNMFKYIYVKGISGSIPGNKLFSKKYQQ